MLKPMLACKAPNVDKLVFPLLASPKLDGIRCTIQNGVALSRTLKPLPQPALQELAATGTYDGLDGEVTVGPHDGQVFSRSTSFCMSKTYKDAPFVFNCFDYMCPDEGFEGRLDTVRYIIDPIFTGKIDDVHHQMVFNARELAAFEAECLAEGYEGVMLRSIDGPYKHGRATVKEGTLMKLKQFADAEALIIGVEERMHNANEATTNELGHTARSSHKAGMEPCGDLGAFICRNKEGVEFSVGSGFTAEERVHLWNIREQLSSGGSYVKYQHFPQGVKDKPRFPTYLGLRNRMDFD